MRHALFALSLAAAGAASAQDADVGHDLYMGGCAACHGIDGTGGGVVAALMTVPMPDLTTLAARNGGVFPMLQVVHVIDGRTGVRAHGDSHMPVFGTLFLEHADGGGDYSAVLATRGRILSLALYLAELQQ